MTENPYGEPISILNDLKNLDSDEVVEGYRDGRNGEPEPKGNRSKSYWHGCRNGSADGGHIDHDSAMKKLARKYINRHKQGI